MKRAALCMALLLGLSVLVSAQAKVGAPIDAFSLTDISGKSRSLNELRGKNGAVVIFLSAQCPVVKGYNDRISQIAAELSGKGVNVVGINSNATESLDWVSSHAAENYNFPVLIDKGGSLAMKLGATVTPEVYYLDAKNTLLYHGAIDNDRSGRNVSEAYLKTAVDATLAGKKVERTSANAFGCSIKFTAN